MLVIDGVVVCTFKDAVAALASWLASYFIFNLYSYLHPYLNYIPILIFISIVVILLPFTLLHLFKLLLSCSFIIIAVAFVFIFISTLTFIIKMLAILHHILSTYSKYIASLQYNCIIEIKLHFLVL